MEILLNGMAVEIEDELIEEMKALPRFSGKTVEELLQQFFRWCSENPDLVEEALRRGQKEEQEANKTKANDKEEISHG